MKTDVVKRSEIFPVRLGRYLAGVGKRFYADQCLLHASALTYTTLLSLVPLLALMFAVLKGLGVQRRLEPVLLSRLSLSPEVTERIVTYIDRTNVGTLGALGAIALITTVVSVLGSIESSFNHIWRVRQSRSYWRKATDYVSTVLLTPFLLLGAVALTSTMQEEGLLHWVLQTEYVGEAALQLLRLAPFVINAVALGILYAVMPNRRPNVPAILVGAIGAGCVWQLVQSAYVSMQIGVARYNAIYGALAQLPVTLVWIYVSWAVVLAGAQLAAVYEFGAEADKVGSAETSRWAIALHLLLRAAEHFRGAGGAVEVRRVAHELRAHTGTVTEIAERLRGGSFLAAVDGSTDTYVLAREPSAVDLATVAHLVDPPTAPPACDPRVADVLRTTTAERDAMLQRRTLADLLDHGVENDSDRV